MSIGIAVAVAALAGLASLALFLATRLRGAGPRECLILSGYRARWARSGKHLCLPVFQAVDRLSLGPFRSECVITELSSDFVPVTVSGVASLVVHCSEATLKRSASTLLGLDQEALAALGRESMEGVLRELVSSTAAAELLELPLFLERAHEQLEAALSRVGLAVESFQILGVTDDVGYLAALRTTRDR